MSRRIEVALPSDRIGQVRNRIAELDGIVGLVLHPDASLSPPGDLLIIHATNDASRVVLRLLDELDVVHGGSITTEQPGATVSLAFQKLLDNESNETIWEEMATLLEVDTNLSLNYLLLMALSGGIAAVGLWTDTLHIVIGAMVLAPGFEPLLRVPMGLICGPRLLVTRGLIATLAGYVTLAAGAAAAFLLLLAVGVEGAAESLGQHPWVQYWTTMNASGLILAIIAGAGGAVTVSAQRGVLSAGVMIALSLIPAMGIVGMALVAGEFELLGLAMLRWAIDAAGVFLAGGLVLGLKQRFLHRRNALG